MNPDRDAFLRLNGLTRSRWGAKLRGYFFTGTLSMFRSHLRAALFVLLIGTCSLAVAAGPVSGRQSAEKVDMGKLTEDTQRTSTDDKNLSLVWWVPPEFWAVSAAQSGGTDQAEIDEFTKLFSKYTIVAVVKGEMGVISMSKFYDENEVRAIARLVDAKGRKLEPIPTKKLESDLVILLSLLKPILKSMIGPAGENMHFLAFPGKDASGAVIADAFRDGEVVVMLDDERFSFKTPLPSLLAPMYDATTGQAFPGTFRYNPYTGSALTPDKR
jgi:hypothetical protein